MSSFYCRRKPAQGIIAAHSAFPLYHNLFSRATFVTNLWWYLKKNILLIALLCLPCYATCNGVYYDLFTFHLSILLGCVLKINLNFKWKTIKNYIKPQFYLNNKKQKKKNTISHIIKIGWGQKRENLQNC